MRKEAIARSRGAADVMVQAFDSRMSEEKEGEG